MTGKSGPINHVNQRQLIERSSTDRLVSEGLEHLVRKQVACAGRRSAGGTLRSAAGSREMVLRYAVN